MARIAGVDIPRDKQILFSLTYIYGIGRTISADICRQTQVDPTVRVRDLSETDVSRLREFIDVNLVVEGDLRREVQMNLSRQMEIGSYRGLRHRRNLPSRGQRTRTNARTRRGRRQTVAGRRRVAH